MGIPSSLKMFISTDGKVFSLGVNSLRTKTRTVNVLFQDFLTHPFWRKTKIKTFSSNSRVNLFSNTYKIIKR
jgi:hypothetical protein